ncbi:hypothetical protein [Paraclostridium bifermentans]|uniref:hypothetical protein n=1 Tax=Paraclostridium bifermentans TaxID=1490 RepID=UPI0034DF7AC5
MNIKKGYYSRCLYSGGAMDSIIKNFRDFINDNVDFVVDVYADKKGRNKWNCICSCMDWIDVSIEYIKNIKYDEDNINIKSMQVYAYISSIDVLWESVQQLHRVIFDTNSIPFTKNTDIFNNQLNIDDNEYFKHLRAVFGAHPVNLKDPSNKDNRKTKYFASWPNEDHFEDYDFVSTLWSADVNSEDLRIGFKFKQLEEFLNIRYRYIQDLQNKLKEDIDKHYSKMSEIKIESSDDIKEQLNILKEELNSRKKDDYYNYKLDKLIGFFNSNYMEDRNNPVIERYLEKLKIVVRDLKNNIQAMNFTELEREYIISPKYPKEIYYNLTKVWDYYHNYGKKVFDYSYYIEPIAEFLKDYVKINYDMEYYDCLLSINSGLFEYWQEAEENKA